MKVASPSPTPGATGDEVESPDWKSIAWGVARLLRVAIAAALVGLFAAEATLRLVGVSPRTPGAESAYDLDDDTPGVYQAGSQFLGRWKAGATFQANFNSWGMRGGEPREGPRPRILVVGDSNTFGYGVEDDETWPAVLDQSLAKAGRPHPVLNLSTVGFVIDDQLRYLEAALPAYRPDIVILMPPPEGFPLSPGAETFHERALVKERRARSLLIGWTQNTAIERARKKIERWRKRLAVRAAATLRTAGRLDAPEESDPQVAAQNGAPVDLELRRRHFAEQLGVLRARVAEAGAQLLIVPLPDAAVFVGGQVSDRSWMDRLAERSWVDQLVREQGIPMADVSERLAAEPDPTTLILGVDDTHPSPRAHRLIAAAVEAELERLGWLE